MDCDQVFMILTRGPFPTGEAWDEQVEAHLESCTDCWRLAEALRPALEVFQEAVPPAESRELPGYWGDARPAGRRSQPDHAGTAYSASDSGHRPWRAAAPAAVSQLPPRAAGERILDRYPPRDRLRRHHSGRRSDAGFAFPLNVVGTRRVAAGSDFSPWFTPHSGPQARTVTAHGVCCSKVCPTAFCELGLRSRFRG